MEIKAIWIGMWSELAIWKKTDGQMDGQTDGRMNKQTEGLTDGQAAGRVN